MSQYDATGGDTRRDDPVAVLLDFVRSAANQCFVCGPYNPVGLHLRFEAHEDTVSANFRLEHWYEGWQGVIHGGVLASVLDETMAYTLFFKGIQAMTARMEIRYRLPLRSGDNLRCRARIMRDSRKLVQIEGAILVDGKIAVEATGHFIKLGFLTRESVERGVESMNMEPLDEMVRHALDRVRRAGGPQDIDSLLTAVLEDSELAQFMEGIKNHDRSGDLDAVYRRDIRRMIERDVDADDVR